MKTNPRWLALDGLEVLETRELLAGVVQVDVGEGDLGILGDRFANNITITQVGDQIIVTGIATGIITTTPSTVRVLGPIAFIDRALVRDDVKLILGRGNDVATIGIDVADDLGIDAGDGNDIIRIANIEIANKDDKTSRSISLGEGNDSLALVNLEVARDFNVYAGAGNDAVRVNGGTYGQNLFLDGGPGGPLIDADIAIAFLVNPIVNGELTVANFEFGNLRRV